METNKILSANILDIIFDERNKDYGTYDLRKSYNSRVRASLLITALLPVILIGMAFITKNSDEDKKNKIFIGDKILVDPIVEPKIIKLPVVLHPIHQQLKTIIFTPPKIVADIQVKDIAPENKDLIEARIETKTQDGLTDDGMPLPQETIKGSNVIETPKTTATEEQPKFIPIEIEASFKGDWNNYIKKEIEKNLDELTEAGESGTCIVKFIVSKNGKVSDVEATTMKGTKLAEIAVNAIRKGPSWIPAQQNGRDVNAYRLQPITFKIQD
jgi:protein TonB